ncbi:MAG: VWA domain-containing protein [Planctomycetota bacterium]|nr:VWA domain-containing protein [Planctomycetota bacterium]
MAILQAPPDLKSKGLSRDAVYVIDISGSMQGIKLDAAKRALAKSLRGLRSDDRFLLIAFDTGLLRYRDDFQVATWLNVKKALWWISNLQVRGGTEMLPAIQIALMGETPAARLRTVLFITDGQASNEDELVATVAKRRKRARFFCLGIDTAVNSALLQKLSRVGGGTCELTGPQGNIEALVSKIEERFGHPLIDDVIVEGGELGAEGGKALFKGRPVTVLLKGSPELIQCRGQAGERTISMETRPAKVPFSLGPLWAKRRIASLQDRQIIRPFERERLRPVITKMALEHSLLSLYTAFVAVDESSEVLKTPHSVIQPVEAPELWSQGSGSGSFYQPRVEDAKLTRDGACIGTPYYLAPEQVQGLKIDQRTDIFCLGLSFYTILTGRRGFDAKNTVGLFRAIINEKLKSPRKVNSAIPKIVSNVILKMTYKKPKHRFQNCEEVLKALHKLPFDWGHPPQSCSEIRSQRDPVNVGNDPIRELIGVTVFDCVIESFYDRDGYCWIFEAKHVSGKRYFIDVMAKGGQVDRMRQRMAAAVGLTSKMEEAHVMRVLALAESAAHFFILRDYMAGETLQDRTRSWVTPQIDESLIYLHQALLGLSEAHKSGLLHGQISPAHMLVSKTGFLKLTDFKF